MLSREQARAARAARGWGVRELAAASGVSFPTISAFENGADSRGGTLRRLQVTLEGEGFTFTNGSNPAVSWDAAAPERWANAKPPQARKAKGAKR